MKDRMEIIGDKFSTVVLFDKEPLLEKIGFGFWHYVHLIDGKTTRVCIPRFDDSYFNLFLDDIKDQLQNGIDRNNLTMNIPHQIEYVQVGNKIVPFKV